jgi:cyclophilin family peptidyl-prolyl cis-trans isomerase
MSVLLETSKGDVVIDLLVDECPVTCKNFLKLCKWVLEAGGMPQQLHARGLQGRRPAGRSV